VSVNICYLRVMKQQAQAQCGELCGDYVSRGQTKRRGFEQNDELVKRDL
jgi:hypothetical protein